jgi:transcriptional regulator with XRE-family HTH domain
MKNKAKRELQLRKEIAGVMKDLRTDFGYSQKVVAEYLEISLYKYRQIEKAERPITITQLGKLKSLYGVNYVYFTDKKEREKFKKVKVRWCGKKRTN